MILKQITFDDLEQYNQIEMLKVFDSLRVYHSLTSFEVKDVEKTTLDFAKEEKMDVWREIMNQDTCGIFVIEEKKWVAGCIVVTHSPKINMLRNDMSNAVLWDIRVDPNYQGKGYGKLLFDEAVDYAKKQHCKQMIIETQNNNTKAISFYEKQGATLLEINRAHYPDCPGEDQLIFFIEVK